MGVYLLIFVISGILMPADAEVIFTNHGGQIIKAGTRYSHTCYNERPIMMYNTCHYLRPCHCFNYSLEGYHNCRHVDGIYINLGKPVKL